MTMKLDGLKEQYGLIRGALQRGDMAALDRIQEKFLESIDFSVAVMICPVWVDPPKLPDNVRGECMQCGGGVSYRPYVPKDAYKVCVSCSGVPAALLQAATPMGRT